MQKPNSVIEKNKVSTGKAVSTTIRKIISTTLTVVVAVCILFVLYAAISGRNENGIAVGPYGVAVIITGSMEPAIRTGSLIVIKSVSEDNLAAGDIITYKPIEGRSDLVTHRIIDEASEDNSFITQGDANDIPDFNPVYYDSIVGKVIFTIPLLGYLINFLKTPQGIVLLILFIILCEIIWRLIRKSKK